MTEREPLDSKLMTEGRRRCVSYYHLCTNYDDWGTLDEHWLQVLAECPATGYYNRYYIRVKNPTGRLKSRRDDHMLAYHSRGVLCVTFKNGAVQEVAWNVKPRGRHANPLENYQHRDDEARAVERASKPDGYGAWE